MPKRRTIRQTQAAVKLLCEESDILDIIYFLQVEAEERAAAERGRDGDPDMAASWDHLARALERVQDDAEG